jgi:phage tail sheath gpL-like
MELTCVALDDAGAATKATGTIVFSGTATAAGTLAFMIGGRKIRVAVASGDAATGIGDDLVTAITADTRLPVTAANVTGTVTLTAKNGGTVAGTATRVGIDTRINYDTGETTPAGVTVVITQVGAVVAGAGDPDVDDVFTAIGDTNYSYFIFPWIDSSNLTKITTELDRRDNPTINLDMFGFTAVRDTQTNLTTFGNALNDRYMSVMGYDDSPTSPEIWATIYGAKVGRSGQIDPALPFKTLTLPGVLAPPESSLFTFTQNDILLRDGISTFEVVGGIVQIQRAITTYQTNAASVADVTFLNVNTPLTLFFIKAQVQTRLLLRYPRHKLADNGADVSAGNIATPDLIRMELIGLGSELVAANIIEDIEAYKTNLVVERDGSDVNRVNIDMGPNLVNQLYVFATKISFRL